MLKDDGTTHLLKQMPTVQLLCSIILEHQFTFQMYYYCSILHLLCIQQVSSRPASSLTVDKHSLGQKPLCSSYFNISQTSFLQNNSACIAECRGCKNALILLNVKGCASSAQFYCGSYTGSSQWAFKKQSKFQALKRIGLLDATV